MGILRQAAYLGQNRAQGPPTLLACTVCYVSCLGACTVVLCELCAKSSRMCPLQILISQLCDFLCGVLHPGQWRPLQVSRSPPAGQ